MRTHAPVPTWIAAVILLAGCATALPAATTGVPAEAPPKLDVVWVPSPPAVITAMLEAAKVGPNDLVYDLGCGEGEILIEAATRYGARGVGVDLDPVRIKNARINAAKAGVADKITFVQQDLFKTDITPATVVTLYLLPELNERLRPTLLRDLRPGTPVVSHDFAMGDWRPERTIEVQVTRLHRVFLWRIPARSSLRAAALGAVGGRAHEVVEDRGDPVNALAAAGDDAARQHDIHQAEGRGLAR
ncbi:MAG TPA: class I SAM-dependent methyltransferase [Methylomirabilota bacterium]|nr:class I SAM-dependent methyltransferase [Methylomirabilota bacterium]